MPSSGKKKKTLDLKFSKILKKFQKKKYFVFDTKKKKDAVNRRDGRRIETDNRRKKAMYYRKCLRYIVEYCPQNTAPSRMDGMQWGKWRACYCGRWIIVRFRSKLMDEIANFADIQLFIVVIMSSIRIQLFRFQ